jgi:hypothetical protein
MDKEYTFTLNRKELLALALTLHVGASYLSENVHLLDSIIDIKSVGFTSEKDFFLTNASTSNKLEKLLDEQMG